MAARSRTKNSAAPEQDQSTLGPVPVPVPASASDILSSSAAGASALVSLQFCSRLLTFALHQIVLRFTNAETLGFAAVKLELLLSTILFLSREGFRGALLRAGSSSRDDREKSPKHDRDHGHDHDQDQTYPIPSTSPQFETQKITNLAYIPTLIGALMTPIACAYFFSTIKPADAERQPFLYTSIVLYGLAAFAELLIEPLMILVMTDLNFGLRVSSEGVAVVLRCLITFAFTIFGSRTMTKDGVNRYGVLAFAIAQLAFALTLAGFYVTYFLRKVWKGEIKSRNLVPQPLVKGHDGERKIFYFDTYLLGLASTMTKQSLLKHVLTEGDKMLVVRLSTETDQGVYAFVVNYGSLIVRILFQPLEETSRTMFSKLLADVNNPPPNSSPATTEKVTPTNSDTSPHKLTAEQHATLLTSLTILTTILEFHILLGLLFICFGANYTATLIDLLVGPRWSQLTAAPAVLSLYCAYVPVMGVNGIVEAFVQAVATSSDLSLLSRWMIIFSLGFVGSGWIFMRALGLGASGLVVASAVNLSMRIAWSWWYIRRYYLVDRGWSLHDVKAEISVTKWMPHLGVWIAFAAAWATTRWSEHLIGWETFRQKVEHIGVGVIALVAVAAVIYRLEREFLRRLVQLGRTRKRDR